MQRTLLSLLKEDWKGFPINHETSVVFFFRHMPPVFVCNYGTTPVSVLLLLDFCGAARQTEIASAEVHWKNLHATMHTDRHPQIGRFSDCREDRTNLRFQQEEEEDGLCTAQGVIRGSEMGIKNGRVESVSGCVLGAGWSARMSMVLSISTQFEDVTRSARAGVAEQVDTIDGTVQMSVRGFQQTTLFWCTRAYYVDCM